MAVARCSASNGFRHLDLLHAFRKCSASRRVHANSMHPNRFGHACAAQEIARHLEASELVGP
jgi:phospholipase/lecithinase/hemolysin